MRHSQNPNDTIINFVHLEGTVVSCRIINEDGDKVKAAIKLCTAKPIPEGDRIKMTNPLMHPVIISASGEKATKLKDLASCMDSTMTESKPQTATSENIIMSIEGNLTTDKTGRIYVQTKEDKISFPKKLSMKNLTILQGRVVQTLSNIAYASAKLEIDNPADDGTTVRIPICISSSDNPKQYAEISKGNVKQGDILSVKGPLISKTYSDGKKEINICSVNVARYNNLSQTQTQTRTPVLSKKRGR